MDAGASFILVYNMFFTVSSMPGYCSWLFLIDFERDETFYTVPTLFKSNEAFKSYVNINIADICKKCSRWSTLIPNIDP